MKSWTSAFSVSSPIAALGERWMQPGWCGAALCWISGSIRLEIKCTVNETCLNHPKTILLPLLHGKVIFHKIVSW